MRTRLRPAHDQAALARIYAAPHRHDRWPAHVIRVAETTALGRELMDLTGHPAVIADLSCGDAAIPRDLIAYDQAPAKRVILGDIAPGYELHGPIEQTLGQVTHAGLFVCTETIEHLDDPDTVLASIRRTSGSLVLSTPAGEEGDLNQEHYWSWNQADVGAMLAAAGWDPVLQQDVSWTDENRQPWVFQIWGCR